MWLAYIYVHAASIPDIFPLVIVKRLLSRQCSFLEFNDILHNAAGDTDMPTAASSAIKQY